MLIAITGRDEIFNSQDFLQDEVTFNLMHLIKEGASTSLHTNKDKSFIIGQSSPSFPAWIWTSRNITDEAFEELKLDFCSLYKDAEKLSFIARPEIIEELAPAFASFTNSKYKVSMAMEAYDCPRVLSYKESVGYLDLPNEDDLEVIAEFFCGFIKECFNVETTIDRQRENAAKYIASGNFYVWRLEGATVAMANIAHRSQRHARINEVYTRPDLRGRGLAGMVVAEVSRIVLKENRIPILYTDLANPYSNKAYKNIGYTECGKVTQVTFELTNKDKI